MASITIDDLQEDFELDKNALANLFGGGGWKSKHWTEVIGCEFTGKCKRRGKRIYHQKKIKYREYKWVSC